ncbi:DNA cytosine methyltransferase [Agrobacterium pusense]|uniref:DNA cytosine methyltransferase n=1 Tax=Agrobacterium pusense TaxID=648995 RepID=UPI0030785F82
MEGKMQHANDNQPLSGKLKVLDLFSGIGGFSLGLEATGHFETVAFCEISEFPRQVLAKNWPGVPCYEDVTKLTADTLRRDGINTIDIITGGFPCQDISLAGKQAGIKQGTRSGLWSEIDRLIGELRPEYVIVENVSNLFAGPASRPGAWFGRVLGDLAERGYDAEWENIPASALGAPHRRERAWLVAYPSKSHAPKILSARPEPQEFRRDPWGDWPDRIDQSFVLRENDGVPGDAHRIGACGNAVVPFIPEFIGSRIASSFKGREQISLMAA